MFELRQSLINRICSLIRPALIRPASSNIAVRCQVVPAVLSSLRLATPTKFDWYTSQSTLCVSGSNYFSAGRDLVVFGELFDWASTEPHLTAVDYYV